MPVARDDEGGLSRAGHLHTNVEQLQLDAGGNATFSVSRGMLNGDFTITAKSSCPIPRRPSPSVLDFGSGGAGAIKVKIRGTIPVIDKPSLRG